jgi:NitT/TauT family transport system permease protein
MVGLAYPAATVVVVLVAWQVVVTGFGIPAYLIPSPGAVALQLVSKAGFLLYHSWVTTYETLGGFLLSILVGVPLAIAIVSSRALDRSITPLLVLSQTFPKVAIAPLLIIWFGLGILPKVLVSFLVAFFPVVISGVTGMRSVETEMLELVRVMRASRLQIFWKVRLPYALPQFFAGLKVAIAFAVVGAVVGEWVGADRGLGYLLLSANANLDTPLLFAVLVLLMLIGTALYYAIVWIERLMLPWHVSVREDIIHPTV